jgi:hypothetical protein
MPAAGTADPGYNVRARIIFHILEFVGAVRAEDEFELQKNGIDLAIAEEEIRFEKVMIILQSQFRKFCGIPG